MKQTFTTILAAVVGAVFFLLLAALFIEASIWAAGVMGLQHALGMDTQSSKNYATSSGVGPMIIAALGFSGVGVTVLHHINCEQKGCWRLGHNHPDHGRPVCRKHYHHNVIPGAGT